MTSEKHILEEIDSIKNELENYPNSAQLQNDLGVGYFLLGKYKESAEQLKKAVQNSNSATYCFNLANTYSQMEEHSMAVDMYLQALDINPNHIGSLNNLADEYELLGKAEKAHELFHYITRLQPEKPLAHFNLGNFFLRQNQHIEAAKCYEVALEKDSSFVDAYYNIAWILFEAKAYKHSLEYLEKGLDIDPTNEELLKLKKDIENR